MTDQPQLSAPTQAWLASGRHVEAGGHRLFVYEQGTGPAILLLHGFPTSCYDWRAVIERLAPAHCCIAFDYPGYGLSDKPEAYSYSLFQQADAVEALARELGLGSVHVVSHDVGTSVHCELLARHNAGELAFDVLSSTFLNGSMLQWLATITPFQQLLSANATLQQAIDLCEGDMKAFVPGLKGIMKRPECVSEDDATVIYELLRYDDGNKRLPAIAGYMRERYVNQKRWIGALSATKPPLQLVWADGDPVANIEMGRELHRMLPDARYTELKGIGHFVPMEDPDGVAGAIASFVAAERVGGTA